MSQTTFSSSCSATTLPTCQLALQQHYRKHSFKHPGDPATLAEKIMQSAPTCFSNATPLISVDDPYDFFIRKFVISIPHPQGTSITLVDIPLNDSNHESTPQGCFKTVHPGWLATADTVRDVAVILTRPTTFKDIDWNENEFKILTQLALEENPEKKEACAEVFLTHLIPPPNPSKTLDTQFIALQERYNDDLFPFVNDPGLASRLPRRYIEEIESKIVSAVCALQNKTGLFHQDLKPENILIKITKAGLTTFNKKIEDLLKEDLPDIEIGIRLCDISFAIPSTQESITHHAGSYAYTSPEAAVAMAKKIRERKTGIAETSDTVLNPGKMEIWSLGLILLCLENYPLFERIVPLRTPGMPCIRKYQKYFAEQKIPEFPEVEGESPKLRMIRRMLDPKPENRPLMQEVEAVFCRRKEDPAFAKEMDIAALPDTQKTESIIEK